MTKKTTLSDKKMEQLLDEVVDQINKDLSQGDRTAIDAMLSHCPVKNLAAFLPEKQMKKYLK